MKTYKSTITISQKMNDALDKYLHNPSTPNGPIWKFTLPNNGITLQAIFPKKEAASIAVRTVTGYKKETDSKIEVIFNVFKREDHEIYREILG